MNRPPIAVTPGEPAGVGPDILCQLFSQDSNYPIVLIADPDLLQARAEKLGLNWPENISIFPVKMAVSSEPGEANISNVPYVLETLKIAHEGCMKGQFSALVTGPVHKGLINQAGIAFAGHTEFFAKLAGCKTLMFFVTPNLKVGLATTHVPLRKVPDLISERLISDSVKLIAQNLKKYFSIHNPRISVLGLNPHAGEGGHMGNEEIEILSPCLDKLREENFQVLGPLPADTAFTQKSLAACDAILALYHDQALPLIKALDFENAVNVTLGLPYLRTSVDHGTAFDLAGSGQANPSSFKAALELAQKLLGF